MNPITLARCAFFTHLGIALSWIARIMSRPCERNKQRKEFGMTSLEDKLWLSFIVSYAVVVVGIIVNISLQ